MARKPRGGLVCLEQGVSEGKSPCLRLEREAEVRSRSLISHKKEVGLHLGVKGKPLKIWQNSNRPDLCFGSITWAAMWDRMGGRLVNSSYVMGSESS